MSQEPQSHGSNDLPVAVAESRKAVWVHCSPCNHTWMAFKLPCELGLSAKLMRATFCPHCHGRKQIVVATEEQIEAAEIK